MGAIQKTPPPPPPPPHKKWTDPKYTSLQGILNSQLKVSMILGSKRGPIILFQFWSYLVTCFYIFSPLSSQEFLGDLFL